MTDWLSRNESRIDEIRKEIDAYYGWKTSGEYVLAKDNLEAHASVHISFLLGEYDVMARVLREDSAIIKKGIELIKIEQAHWSGYASTPEEYEDLRYKTAQEFWEMFNNLSDDAKELLG